MINLSNYEDWFLLYADGELTVAEQEAVLQFVNVHPDLKEELDLFLSMRFQPETTIKFENEASLKAEFFNELETKYRFEPDLTIQFPDKQLLYKRTAMPVISMFRYAAVAASTIVTAGLIWWFTGNTTVEQPIVQAETKTIAPVILPAEEFVVQQKDVAVVTQPIKGNSYNSVTSTVAVNKVEKETLPTQQEDDQFNVAKVEPVIMPLQNEQLRSNFSQDAIAAAEARMNKTTAIVAPTNAANAINTAMLIDAEMDDEPQVPVRGLLRKISRTLLGEEKEEGDGKKYVQFAVFQIPVKQ